MTLKSQCYFDFLGCLSGNNPLLAILELRIHRTRWSVQQTRFDDRHNQHHQENPGYGVPVNQLSLIYLVKEH